MVAQKQSNQSRLILLVATALVLQGVFVSTTFATNPGNDFYSTSSPISLAPNNNNIGHNEFGMIDSPLRLKANKEQIVSGADLDATSKAIEKALGPEVVAAAKKKADKFLKDHEKKKSKNINKKSKKDGSNDQHRQDEEESNVEVDSLQENIRDENEEIEIPVKAAQMQSYFSDMWEDILDLGSNVAIQEQPKNWQSNEGVQEQIEKLKSLGNNPAIRDKMEELQSNPDILSGIKVITESIRKAAAGLKKRHDAAFEDLDISEMDSMGSGLETKNNQRVDIDCDHNQRNNLVAKRRKKHHKPPKQNDGKQQGHRKKDGGGRKTKGSRRRKRKSHPHTDPKETIGKDRKKTVIDEGHPSAQIGIGADVVVEKVPVLSPVSAPTRSIEILIPFRPSSVSTPISPSIMAPTPQPTLVSTPTSTPANSDKLKVVSGHHHHNRHHRKHRDKKDSGDHIGDNTLAPNLPIDFRPIPSPNDIPVPVPMKDTAPTKTIVSELPRPSETPVPETPHEPSADKTALAPVPSQAVFSSEPFEVPDNSHSSQVPPSQETDTLTEPMVIQIPATASQTTFEPIAVISVADSGPSSNQSHEQNENEEVEGHSPKYEGAPSLSTGESNPSEDKSTAETPRIVVPLTSPLIEETERNTQQSKGVIVDDGDKNEAQITLATPTDRFARIKPSIPSSQYSSSVSRPIRATNTVNVKAKINGKSDSITSTARLSDPTPRGFSQQGPKKLAPTLSVSSSILYPKEALFTTLVIAELTPSVTYRVRNPVQAPAMDRFHNTVSTASPSLSPLATPTPLTPALAPSPLSPVVTPTPLTPALVPLPLSPVATPTPLDPELAPELASSPPSPVATPTPLAPALVPLSLPPVATPTPLAPELASSPLSPVATPMPLAPALVPSPLSQVVTPTSLDPVLTESTKPSESMSTRPLTSSKPSTLSKPLSPPKPLSPQKSPLPSKSLALLKPSTPSKPQSSSDISTLPKLSDSPVQSPSVTMSSPLATPSAPPSSNEDRSTNGNKDDESKEDGDNDDNNDDDDDNDDDGNGKKNGKVKDEPKSQEEITLENENTRSIILSPTPSTASTSGLKVNEENGNDGIVEEIDQQNSNNNSNNGSDDIENNTSDIDENEDSKDDNVQDESEDNDNKDNIDEDEDEDESKVESEEEDEGIIAEDNQLTSIELHKRRIPVIGFDHIKNNDQYQQQQQQHKQQSEKESQNENGEIHKKMKAMMDARESKKAEKQEHESTSFSEKKEDKKDYKTQEAEKKVFKDVKVQVIENKESKNNKHIERKAKEDHYHHRHQQQQQQHHHQEEKTVDEIQAGWNQKKNEKKNKKQSKQDEDFVEEETAHIVNEDDLMDIGSPADFVEDGYQPQDKKVKKKKNHKQKKAHSIKDKAQDILLPDINKNEEKAIAHGKIIEDKITIAPIEDEKVMKDQKAHKKKLHKHKHLDQGVLPEDSTLQHKADPIAVVNPLVESNSNVIIKSSGIQNKDPKDTDTKGSHHDYAPKDDKPVPPASNKENKPDPKPISEAPPPMPPMEKGPGDRKAPISPPHNNNDASLNLGSGTKDSDKNATAGYGTVPMFEPEQLDIGSDASLSRTNGWRNSIGVACVVFTATFVMYL
ncbi:hypothetical protein FBU30_006096 [Linnemannia zychae]|nr:hypothetical protein FBU30_006096 [Linnemannia zychae]